MGRREVAAARGMVSSPRGRRSSPRGSGSTARSIQMSHVCCLLQSAHTHCHLDLSSFLISARLELKDLSKAINLVQTRRNLVENDRVLLNPAHRAQQEYERVASCCLSGEQEKMFKRLRCFEDCRRVRALGVRWACKRWGPHVSHHVPLTSFQRIPIRMKGYHSICLISPFPTVDEWHEQPAAIGVQWVTIDGQIVGAWINLV
uniref:Uncharacterized protein n=1 Tax=Oryza glumipatula TaxID=40148 RepID=A0A0D9ZL09_9ORYZ